MKIIISNSWLTIEITFETNRFSFFSFWVFNEWIDNEIDWKTILFLNNSKENDCIFGSDRRYWIFNLACLCQCDSWAY